MKISHLLILYPILNIALAALSATKNNNEITSTSSNSTTTIDSAEPSTYMPSSYVFSGWSSSATSTYSTGTKTNTDYNGDEVLTNIFYVYTPYFLYSTTVTYTGDVTETSTANWWTNYYVNDGMTTAIITYMIYVPSHTATTMSSSSSTTSITKPSTYMPSSFVYTGWSSSATSTYSTGTKTNTDYNGDEVLTNIFYVYTPYFLYSTTVTYTGDVTETSTANWWTNYYVNDGMTTAIITYMIYVPSHTATAMSISSSLQHSSYIFRSNRDISIPTIITGKLRTTAAISLQSGEETSHHSSNQFNSSIGAEESTESLTDISSSYIIESLSENTFVPSLGSGETVSSASSLSVTRTFSIKESVVSSQYTEISVGSNYIPSSLVASSDRSDCVSFISSTSIFRGGEVAAKSRTRTKPTSGKSEQSSSGYDEQSSSGYGEQSSSGYDEQSSSGYGEQPSEASAAHSSEDANGSSLEAATETSSTYGEQSSSGYGEQPSSGDVSVYISSSVSESASDVTGSINLESDPGESLEYSVISVESSYTPSSLVASSDRSDCVSFISSTSIFRGGEVAAKSRTRTKPTSGKSEQSSSGYDEQSSSGYDEQSSSGYGEQPSEASAAHSSEDANGSSLEAATETSSTYGEQSSSGYGEQSSSGYDEQSSSGYDEQSSSGYGEQPSEASAAHSSEDANGSSLEAATETSSTYGEQSSSGYGEQPSSGDVSVYISSSVSESASDVTGSINLESDPGESLEYSVISVESSYTPSSLVASSDRSDCVSFISSTSIFRGGEVAAKSRTRTKPTSGKSEQSVTATEAMPTAELRTSGASNCKAFSKEIFHCMGSARVDAISRTRSTSSFKYSEESATGVGSELFTSIASENTATLINFTTTIVNARLTVISDVFESSESSISVLEREKSTIPSTDSSFTTINSTHSVENNYTTYFATHKNVHFSDVPYSTEITTTSNGSSASEFISYFLTVYSYDMPTAASSTAASSTVASSTVASSTVASSTAASSTVASSTVASSTVASSTVASSTTDESSSAEVVPYYLTTDSNGKDPVTSTTYPAVSNVDVNTNTIITSRYIDISLYTTALSSRTLSTLPYTNGNSISSENLTTSDASVSYEAAGSNIMVHRSSMISFIGFIFMIVIA
ncbi:hypothetical protein TPHA_0P00100 [Tetrapisispora phaffii CBS 4417]|uniref:Flo11 domain-containing protein n=1 Tax=Tetrapisispora phaffii (strain ATCC 24235 / CBS 4417 / NBRC 1672 / NRRL Y-8282 / UCD 70-5) TaxID=1071381 RepID=G8C1Z0_TETPH|nr:hypothetical protein TPHA_0P00100 [Tetrapisispora phaffii CBS 4417]CCE66168.1 hypothetical protein TPHA_0P00100 [Tetrapisispora phaffii CBS 4417]